MESTIPKIEQWTVTEQLPSSQRAFRLMLGFAMCISGFVVVEPAPVDALMGFLIVYGVVTGAIRLSAVSVVP
jgi:hypothetical protein